MAFVEEGQVEGVFAVSFEWGRSWMLYCEVEWSGWMG